MGETGVQSSGTTGFEGERVVESAEDSISFSKEVECVNSVTTSTVQEAAQSPAGRQALASYLLLNRALHLSTEEPALQDGSASVEKAVEGEQQEENKTAD